MCYVCECQCVFVCGGCGDDRTMCVFVAKRGYMCVKCDYKRKWLVVYFTCWATNTHHIHMCVCVREILDLFTCGAQTGPIISIQLWRCVSPKRAILPVSARTHMLLLGNFNRWNAIEIRLISLISVLAKSMISPPKIDQANVHDVPTPSAKWSGSISLSPRDAIAHIVAWRGVCSRSRWWEHTPKWRIRTRSSLCVRSQRTANGTFIPWLSGQRCTYAAAIVLAPVVYFDCHTGRRGATEPIGAAIRACNQHTRHSHSLFTHLNIVEMEMPRHACMRV